MRREHARFTRMHLEVSVPPGAPTRGDVDADAPQRGVGLRVDAEELAARPGARLVRLRGF